MHVCVCVFIYLFNWQNACDRRIDGQRQEWGRGITFNEAGSSHGPFRLKKKKVDFTCQSLERGLTAHGFGVFFQMADAILCFA